MRVLAVNAGSSSLKASLIDGGSTVTRVTIDRGPDASHVDPEDGFTRLVEALVAEGIEPRSIEAVGHRVVHGGPDLTTAARVDDDLIAAVEALSELAPLHNAVAVETIRAARRRLPGVTHVACFDTGFHEWLPETTRRYPVPERWTTDWGIRRYGFHGLSVAWSTTRAAELLGRPVEAIGLVVAHLGSGCSVTAVDGGRSVSTSMGLTPLEGLMMGTRAGSIDPGILLYLLRTERLGLAELTEALDHASGLVAVSGRTSDIRELEAAADAGDGPAALALVMFVERAAAGIAAAATALSRLDAIVFTGGIGEHAGRIRAGIVGRLAVLGSDPIPTDETGEDRILEPVASRRPVRDPPVILRIEAREDLVIAREVVALLDR